MPYYSLYSHGGTWDGTRYYCDGVLVTDSFFFDGAHTYYLMNDGTPMKDRLTCHPDGEHIIYFDANGYETFASFVYCSSVGYTCYFDSNGYLYKDEITFVGDKAYYLNGNGKLENSGWFQFANGMDYGYANWDGTLITNGFSNDPWGRIVFYHWNGMVARGLITDGAWYYSMDVTDGHYLGQFVNNSVTMHSKKGLQGSYGIYEDPDLNVNCVLENTHLSSWISDTPTTESYNYNGTTYYFKPHPHLDDEVRRANERGIKVSLVLLMTWDESHLNMIAPSARVNDGSHAYFALNGYDPQVGALFCYLAMHYGQPDCHIDNWILGNEVNMPNLYNYTGTLDVNMNASIYADSFLTLYNALQNLNPYGKAYISLDHSWTHNDEGRGIAGKSYLNAFHAAINARQQNVNWNLAYHLYTPIMTSSRMWLPKYRRYTPQNENAQFISAVNLNALTGYVQNNFGPQTRIILSEQGFDCHEGNQYQAAALAYTFYAAQFNDMVDEVLFRTYMPDENDGIFDFGLKDGNGTPREAYEVFKYMDTEMGHAYTDPYLQVIGVPGWDSLIPNYKAEVIWQ